MTVASGVCQYAGVGLPLWSGGVRDWVARQIPLEDYWPFDAAGWYNYDLNHLQLPSPYQTREPPRPGTVVWPVGAANWAYGHFVVNSTTLSAIRQAADYPGAARPLVLGDAFNGAPVSAAFRLLPPRRLLVGTAPATLPDGTTVYLPTADGELYLITLVDDRYFWWQLPVTVGHPTMPATWGDYFEAVAQEMGIALSVPTVPTAYLPPTSRFRVKNVPGGLLLDAAADAVGMRVVRGLDGSVGLQQWEPALASSYANLARFTRVASSGDYKGWGHVRGGGLIDPRDIVNSIPWQVALVFGRREHADGQVFDEQLALGRTLFGYTGGLDYGRSLSAYFGASAVGMTEFTARVTCDAYGLGPAGSSAVTNLDTLSAHANQAAYDWYGWRRGDLDVELAGIVPWEKDAHATRVRWTYDDGAVSTRVAREPYSDHNVYGYYPVTASGGGGEGDTGFWAALTAKSDADCPAYSFVEVEEDGVPDDWAAVAGGRTGTAYEVNCVDLPTAAVGENPTVVRVYQDADGDYYFFAPARWEYVRPTGAVSGGVYPGVAVRFVGTTPTDDGDVDIIDLNT